MQARCLGSANIRHLFISCLLEWRQLSCCVISDEADEKVLEGLRELGQLGYRPVGSVEPVGHLPSSLSLHTNSACYPFH